MGNTTNYTSFSQVSSLKLSEIKNIFPTQQNTFVVKNDDSLWATGYNGGYGLVTNTTASGNISKFTQSKYTGGNIKQIDAYAQSAFMLLNDGTIYSIGSNSYGQLGTGNTTKSVTWVKTNQISDVVKISTANQAILALKSDGTVWGAGYLSYGQLGNSISTNVTKTYTKSTSISDVIDIACANGASIALKSDGTIYTSGTNSKGQLGQGDTTSRSAFTKVNGVDNVKSVYAGSYFLVILKNDGSLWGTGANYGQFNNGSSSGNIKSFTKITDNVKTVFVGQSHIAYIKNDGNLYVVGSNGYGQLGIGTTGNILTTETKNTLINDTINYLYPYISEDIVTKYLIKSLSKYYTINSSNILEETTLDIENGITIDKINENIDIMPDSFSLVGAEEKSIQYSGLKDELLIQNELSNIICPKVYSIQKECNIPSDANIKFIFKTNIDTNWKTLADAFIVADVPFNVNETNTDDDLWNETKNSILENGIDINNISSSIIIRYLSENNVTGVKFAIAIGLNSNESLTMDNFKIETDLNECYMEMKDDEYTVNILDEGILAITPNISSDKIRINIV